MSNALRCDFCEKISPNLNDHPELSSRFPTPPFGWKKVSATHHPDGSKDWCGGCDPRKELPVKGQIAGTPNVPSDECPACQPRFPGKLIATKALHCCATCGEPV